MRRQVTRSSGRFSTALAISSDRSPASLGCAGLVCGLLTSLTSLISILRSFSQRPVPTFPGNDARASAPSCPPSACHGRDAEQVSSHFASPSTFPYLLPRLHPQSPPAWPRLPAREYRAASDAQKRAETSSPPHPTAANSFGS